MPEAVLVAAARSPIGRAVKGSLNDVRPDDLAAQMIRDGARQGPRARPARRRRRVPRLRPPRRRERLQHGPHRQRDERHGRRPRRHHHPLLRLLGADHADGVPRDQGRRGRRVRLGRGRDGLPLRPGQLRLLAEHPQPAVRRRRWRARPTGPSTAPAARPGTTRARTGSLPDAYIAMGQTAENVATLARADPATSSTSSAYGRRTSPRRPSPTASGSARSRRSRRRTAPSSRPTTARAPASPSRRSPA